MAKNLGKMRMLYRDDGKCAGLLLSKPWRDFSSGMRRCCRAVIRRAFGGWTTGPAEEEGRTLVVAGSYAQASYWARQWGLETWVYAIGPESLRGWLPARIRYCGTYGRRRDWAGLLDELRCLEARMRRARPPENARAARRRL